MTRNTACFILASRFQIWLVTFGHIISELLGYFNRKIPGKKRDPVSTNQKKIKETLVKERQNNITTECLTTMSRCEYFPEFRNYLVKKFGAVDHRDKVLKVAFPEIQIWSIKARNKQQGCHCHARFPQKHISLCMFE